MFERFTPAAKELVVEAQFQRSVLGEEKIRTGHLLLALLADGGPSGDVLRRLGLKSDRMKARLSGPDKSADATAAEADDELLKGLGIDIDAVRRSLDQTFGTGALDRARGRHKPDQADGSRRASGRFDSRSKRVLELSLREALRLKTKHIGPEHIGLGILREGQGVACGLLSEEGVDLDELRACWEAVSLGATTC